MKRSLNLFQQKLNMLVQEKCRGVGNGSCPGSGPDMEPWLLQFFLSKSEWFSPIDWLSLHLSEEPDFSRSEIHLSSFYFRAGIRAFSEKAQRLNTMGFRVCMVSASAV